MSKRTKRRFAICVDNSGYVASLELHKIYRVVPDAAAEREGGLRVARLQEGGQSNRLGESYAATLKRIVEVEPVYGECIAFALTFWECWVQAARHDWRVYATVAEADWPRFARRVARDVRRGNLLADPELLDQLQPGDDKTRPKWFRGLYGPSGRIDRGSRAG